jgi:hypothetical protein
MHNTCWVLKCGTHRKGLGEKSIIKIFIICTSRHIRGIFRVIKKTRIRWEGPNVQVWERAFWCVHLKKCEHLEVLGAGGRLILKHILKKGDKIMCAGFISLGRETSSEL